ncbi:sensor histidine kinase [Enterococcus sp. HY326]|uniref:sensor histidine kinase n=1 Tax=Enterococcus sp. HY326 TaxID=2971265 RepID=UPI002240C856|nr:HAMP domain-containing sensor histidine kinase [Enterococcus sp. HY326]
MGQRRSKTLILIFLLMIICGGLLWLNSQRMQTAITNERDILIGQLAATGEFSEAEIIQLITTDFAEETRATGQNLSAKYGLTDALTPQQHIMQNYQIVNLVIVGLSFLLMATILLWRQRYAKKIFQKMTEELAHQQEQLERTTLQLQRQSNEGNQVKESITDIAHQLKTPVASLRLSMEIALSENYSKAERESFAKQTEVQINKLDLMLDGLVKISQLEAELICLKPQAYSLKKIVEEVINGLIMKALQQEIDIELEQTADAVVFVDRKWTREAIGNVLENAIKYSPLHSVILVRLSALVTYALIEILDEGPGIPKGEVNLIYQRFYRGTEAETSSLEGSGVGLYLTRKIIEEQGGVVKMLPRIPEGSNFQLTLPLSR